MENKYLKWLEEHRPDNNMVYKDAWYEVYRRIWWNKILPMFSDAWNKPGRKNLGECNEDMNNVIDIVGRHRSKSMLHPVLRINYHGTVIVFRYNFYDYNVTVISNKQLNLPMKELFKSREETMYHEGFPEEYVIEDRYEDNKSRFMVCIDDHFKFYTFLFLLKRQILYF